jgi:hypothetical protein
MTMDHKVGCTGKKVFTTFAQAQRAAQRKNRNADRSHLEAYHCRSCGFCHVGEARHHGRRDRRKDALNAD